MKDPVAHLPPFPHSNRPFCLYHAGITVFVHIYTPHSALPYLYIRPVIHRYEHLGATVHVYHNVAIVSYVYVLHRISVIQQYAV